MVWSENGPAVCGPRCVIKKQKSSRFLPIKELSPNLVYLAPCLNCTPYLSDASDRFYLSYSHSGVETPYSETLCDVMCSHNVIIIIASITSGINNNISYIIANRPQ